MTDRARSTQIGGNKTGACQLTDETIAARYSPIPPEFNLSERCSFLGGQSSFGYLLCNRSCTESRVNDQPTITVGKRSWSDNGETATETIAPG